MKILKFYTPTCVPCKVVGKLLEKVDTPVEGINATEDIEKVDLYNVCTTPTLIFLNKEDKEVGRLHGIPTLNQIQEIIDKNK